MKKEMIDQLDEFGNYISVVDKNLAHELGLWHKVVHVWIINDNNEIMLQYRCAQKKFFPDVWDTSFAGHIDAGETSLEAVLREGKEELGIDIDTSKLIHLFKTKEQLVYNDMISNEHVDVFLLKDNIKLEDLVLQDIEVGEVKYMSVSRFFEALEDSTEKIMEHPGVYKQLKKSLFNIYNL